MVGWVVVVLGGGGGDQQGLINKQKILERNMALTNFNKYSLPTLDDSMDFY